MINTIQQTRYRMLPAVQQFGFAILVSVGLMFAIAVADDKTASTAPRDTPQGELHNVVARVIYPNEVRDLSRQAALEPGPFTIPQGYVATNFIYRWEDPKTDRKNDKLTATTIYSVTERRYITEAKNNPKLVLPAGEYKVVCGGLPEATGVLTYTIFREDLVNKPTEPNPPERGERIIEVETWAAKPNNANYNPKQKATYRIHDNNVTGVIQQVLDPPNYGAGVKCDPIPVQGTFTGQISGNVITGRWEVKHGPYQMHFSAIPGTDYPAHDRTDVYTLTFNNRLTLNADNSLSETMRGEAVSNTQWGPTAPKAIANQRDTFKSKIEIPGENFAEPIQGTWKERK